MITVTTPHGVLKLARIAPGDTETIHARCAHGLSLFGDCRDCELEWLQEECTAFVRTALDLPARVLCEECGADTPFVYPVGPEAWMVCDRCRKGRR